MSEKAAVSPLTVPDVRGALSCGTGRLRAAGIATPRLDARLLLAHVLEIEAYQLVARPERTLDPAQMAGFRALVDRRARREPVARILGEREFWSLPIMLGRATLEPRPDSETLIEAVLAEITDRTADMRILDLGTGSGCLLLAALSILPGASGWGIDISAEAIDVAIRNSSRLGLDARATFLQGDWPDAPVGPFDLVLSNPPYIPTHRIARLEPEVAAHDPRQALDGGPDGLAAYRALAPVVRDRLADEGVAIVEIGEDQREKVARIFSRAGLVERACRHDLRGQDRCLVLGMQA